ncbi:brain-specific angiogenesis inhibitor 1-associated protein 2-like protein 1a isoform X1 [Tachysurus fulvidraco]|uniref:brain-specific angiogenesis inhibitor 1-associated protein 2-like protein 1a isoform X1 n=1 Tax=Tachysurus fulvidraco TaxID=1234273 RepID=UPI001FF02FB7|nr:brain-specific angiogenesis inhibitor 1-associated protein 2-like protein 1a isoform X1 [Tachysurus fulvidraco]
MSRDPDDVNKLTESTYKNVMEQFNPGLRNLVNLGKNYEKSVTAMTLAGKTYFDAVSKIGENAAVSPVSRELGVVLVEISDMHKKVQMELEESFKRFHRDLIAELEKKTDMDVKYMNATFKRYQSEHKMRQDSLDKTHADLKKLRRKSQGKHSSKYDMKQNEYMETISSRQTDMQKFIAEGCREALLEEKRRFCFLVDKHCTFSYQMAEFHDKAKEILSLKLPSWQSKCSDALQVPDTIITMIEGMHTPISNTPKSSPLLDHYNRNSDPMVPPPAPPLKAQTSPLANMFSQEIPRSPVSPEPYSADQDSLDGMSRSTSVSSDMHIMKKPRVQTIFPHTAGNNESLLSFDDGEIITLLIQEERDGWIYGELDRNGQKGWFPSSYCRPYSESMMTKLMNVADLSKQSEEDEEEDEEEEQPVFLPPPDYGDSFRKPSTPSTQSTAALSNGTSKPPFLGGGNPFSTVRLRPTVTNDRSAPVI